MSCPSCFSWPCQCGPDCVTDVVQSCEYPDPGIEVSGAHLSVLDYLFQSRRLANSAGFLINRVTGSGFAISWTLDPQVLHTGLNLPLNTTFTGLLAATGTAGNYRRLIPTALGYLQANADGTWQLVSLPAQAVPDPLTLTTIAVTNLTATDLTVTGLPIFSALANDAITQNIGLNAANELVIGSVAQGSVAKFHENVTETSPARPNASLVAGNYIKFTNEIYDVDNIASTVNSERIKIDIAGTYIVRWGVGFGRHPAQSSAQNWQPIVGLEYNGAIASYGDNPDGTFSKDSALTATGEFLADFAVNDFLQLKITGTASGTNMPANGGGTNSGVNGANLVLTRIK